MKDFISKLNDRNLQRKRESGFTSYVIYSVFLLVLYKLFKIFEYFLIRTEYEPDNLSNTIWLICFTFNALFNLGYSINLLFPNLLKLYSLLPFRFNFNNLHLFHHSDKHGFIYYIFILHFCDKLLGNNPDVYAISPKS